MPNYLCLLRGINVAGQKLIKMDALREIFKAQGYQSVSTYIQTGNIFFSHPESSPEKVRSNIESMLHHSLGYEVAAIIREAHQMQDIFARNPFANREEVQTKQIYIAYLDQVPSKENIIDFEAMSNDIEEVRVVGEEVWFLYGNGAGNAKITNQVLEKKLKVTSTSRNWNSTSKLRDLLLRM